MDDVHELDARVEVVVDTRADLDVVGCARHAAMLLDRPSSVSDISRRDRLDHVYRARMAAPRRRDSARVVVVDDSGCVLLIRVVDPLDDGRPIWITPGGGIEPGETRVDTARRELREETGVDVEIERLGAPAAVTRGEWTFRGEPMFSEDWFFVIRLPRFDPSDDGWEEHERELHHSWRWWSCDELDAPYETVTPGGLAALIRAFEGDGLPDVPLELPWVAL